LAFLPPEWIDHIAAGVSHRLGSCSRDGRPGICRALAADLLPDGRLLILVAGDAGREVLQSIRDTRQVAAVLALPTTHRTLHVKGHDARVVPATPEHQALLVTRREAFLAQLEPFGFSRDALMINWYTVHDGELMAVSFTISGAWNQSPGPGAGQPVELLPSPPGRHGDEDITRAAEDESPRPSHEGTPTHMHAAPVDEAPLSLLDVRRILEGVIPPAMCSVSADGVPHVNYLSHAEYIDPDHLALTFQFFNRSRQNILATHRVALAVDDPYTGASVVMQLQYLRTETAGPVFERLRAKLAGIAAHTGMEKVFKLQGADIYRVLALRRVDHFRALPGLVARCDLAAGARALSQRLADCDDLAELLQTTMDGLQQALHIDHAILWLLDERRQGLFTLASCGYERAGIGAELPLDDAGLAGVALREGVPVRIGHMTQMYRYGMAWRARAQSLGLEAVIRDEIPLPGLAAPRSQLAVPLRARGRTVGALLVESDHDQFFSYDDEDALALLGGQLAQALAALHSAELEAGVPVRPLPAPEPAAATVAAPAGPPLRIRHYPRDDSVFIDDAYLIKGVAGAIFWKLANEVVQRKRSEFTTRELRLAGGDLRLPDVQDNLSVRLLLLQRRLVERSCPIQIERTGRGRFRLVMDRPLELAALDGSARALGAEA
jgi:hypothetical protein